MGINAAAQAPAWRHVCVLLGARFLTGAGQIILYRLTGGNGVNITETISRFAGRLSALRTLGSAVLSVLLVGMGASLGREGAPKQAGAVISRMPFQIGRACLTSNASSGWHVAPGQVWRRPMVSLWEVAERMSKLHLIS
jgi:H+/Cl- antiporter ClcA